MNGNGELHDSIRLRAAIKIDKVNERKRQMRYYQIVISELDKSKEEIIDIYHGLTCGQRTLKSFFKISNRYIQQVHYTISPKKVLRDLLFIFASSKLGV